MDVASGESKRFLKRLWKKRRRDQRKFRKVLAYLFQRIRGRRNRHQSINEVKTTNGDDDWVWVETPAEQKKRKSCPETMLLGTNRHMQMQSPPKVWSFYFQKKGNVGNYCSAKLFEKIISNNCFQWRRRFF